MSHVRRSVRLRVLVVARSGPVRSAVFGAFAYDPSILVAVGVTTLATRDDIARIQPDVVVLDCTTTPRSDALIDELRSLDRAPAIVAVVDEKRIGRRGEVFVQRPRGRSDDDLLDFQGEIVGAVSSAGTSRMRTGGTSTVA